MSDEELSAPLLSICIPAYNRPAWLERAILSIFTATAEERSHIEVVISDDSTLPECREIVEALMRSWAGQWQYQANSPALGMAANWNHCIQMASGRYVLILHDDDYLATDAPGQILQVLQQNSEASALLFGVNVVTTLQKIRRQQVVETQMHLDPERALTRILTNSSFIRFPGIVMKRKVFTQVGHFDKTVGGIADIDMWVKICRIYGLRCIPTVTANYTVHTDALTMGMFTDITVRGLESIFDRVQAQGWLPADQLQVCKTNYFHQFILAGTIRFLRQSDTKGAQAVWRLFNQVDIQHSKATAKWKAIRLILNSFMTLTSLFTSEQLSNGAERKSAIDS